MTDISKVMEEPKQPWYKWLFTTVLGLLSIASFGFIAFGIIASKWDFTWAKWGFVICLGAIALFVVINIIFAWIINPIQAYLKKGKQSW